MNTRRSLTKIVWAMVAIVATASFSQAAVVTGWDMSNVTIGAPTNVTDPGFVFDQFNYIEPGTLIDPYTGAVAADGFMPSGYSKYAVGANFLPNGAMTWKERDTQGPGLSIVTGDDKTGENCITAAGWNPESTPTATQMSDWWGIDLKMCSDPWQSSKRFKLVGYAIDGPVDLTFNVVDNSYEDIYRILQKYGNHTGSRATGFTMQLGFVDANGVFTEATPGQGLAFSLKNGSKFDNANPTASSAAIQGELDALMAHGLFGAPDKHHATAGYYNPYVRASFALSAGETYINTTGLSQEHRALFGEWLPADQMKGAYYFDMDANIYTDNALVASCDGNFDEEVAQTLGGVAGCDGQWVTYRESVNVTQNADGTWNIPPSVGTDIRQPIPVSDAQIAIWDADPLWIPGDIDDLANVNINTFIVVGNANNWPTADGNGNAQFTLRVTPQFDINAAATEPGTAGPAEFVVNP